MSKNLKLTVNQKEFLKTEFKTPKGGVLTVQRALYKNKDKRVVYELFCSICSEDKELWPEGSIRTTKRSLITQKTIPCGCGGKITQPSQNITIINRFLGGAESNLICTGYLDDAKGKTRYILECGVCSKDDELWPYGSIYGQKSDILKGKLPCGCSHVPTYTSEQNLIRLKRACVSRGYSLVQPVPQDLQTKTKVWLYNPLTDNTWEASLSTLTRGVGDPRVYNMSCPDHIHIQQMLASGNFAEGTKFWRSDRELPNKKKPFWNVFCPVCAKDEYSKAELCNGVFVSRQATLKRGMLPCRCSERPTYSLDQLVFKTSNLCKEDGIRYLGVSSDFKGQHTTFKWICVAGHNNESSFKNFFAGNRCRTCHPGGYLKDNPGRLYIVRWFYKGGTFIKFGITNRSLCSRLEEQQEASGLRFEVLYDLWCTDGNTALVVEGHLKRYFGRKGFIDKQIFPDGFSETIEDSEENLEILNSLVHNKFVRHNKNPQTFCIR